MAFLRLKLEGEKNYNNIYRCTSLNWFSSGLSSAEAKKIEKIQCVDIKNNYIT